MASIPVIKGLNDSEIRQKNQPRSITTDNVADGLDRLSDELISRGCIVVENTAELQAQLSTNTKQVFVKDVGLFVWEPSGTANGTTIFDADDTGVYVLEQRSTPATLYNSNGTITEDRTVNITGVGNDLVINKIEGDIENNLSVLSYGLTLNTKNNSVTNGSFVLNATVGTAYSGGQATSNCFVYDPYANSIYGLQATNFISFMLGMWAFSGTAPYTDNITLDRSASFYTLGNITSNKTVTSFPPPTYGAVLLISCINTNTSFSWNIVSAGYSILNPSGSEVTSFENGANYIIMGIGSVWTVFSKYNT